MKKLLFLFLLTSFIVGSAVANSNKKNKITWNNFDLISQFKLIQLGRFKQEVKQWNLEHFDSSVSYVLQREDSSIGAILEYVVKTNKYEVTTPRTIVDHGKKYDSEEKKSSCKGKYRYSYGTLLRPIEIENEALENINQGMLIEELK